MDEGTYADDRIASLISKHYIAVKVDRDERPDVDARYQKAVSAMTGQGGWPLTVFLDDRGRPFYGGTYFPPVSTGDMPGFADLIERIHNYYTTRKDEREEVARSVMGAVSAHDRFDEEDVGSAEIRACLMKIAEEADMRNGGFGYAPKFPHVSALEFLMALHARGNKEAQGRVRLTLDRMQAGGIHDQLGGGFHRYSTDEKWIVPHFEKMAYDNAGLLRNYVHAYQIFGDEEYARTARGIVHFVKDSLSCEEGFCSSQDADAAPGDDGDYWTWSPVELSSVLEGKELRVAESYYHVRGMAEMHRKDRHVLFRAMDFNSLSAEIGATQQETAALLESASRKMLDSRTGRQQPAVDRTVFGSWNGMMASAFFDYSRCFGDKIALDLSGRSVRRYLKSSFSAESGFGHTQRQDSIRGLLEDQVHMLHASLDLFEMESEQSARDVACMSADLLESYRSPAGGLYDAAPAIYNGEEIGLSSSRNTPIYDSPSQSPNAAAALLLQRVGAVLEDENAMKLAGSIIRSVAPQLVSSGAYGASIFIALDQMVNGVPVIVVVGSAADQSFSTLSEMAGRIYLPGKETVLIDTDAASADSYSSTMQSMIARSREAGRPLAFSCIGKSCSMPVDSPAALKRLVSE